MKIRGVFFKFLPKISQVVELIELKKDFAVRDLKTAFRRCDKVDKGSYFNLPLTFESATSERKKAD